MITVYTKKPLYWNKNLRQQYSRDPFQILIEVLAHREIALRPWHQIFLFGQGKNRRRALAYVSKAKIMHFQLRKESGEKSRRQHFNILSDSALHFFIIALALGPHLYVFNERDRLSSRKAPFLFLVKYLPGIRQLYDHRT